MTDDQPPAKRTVELSTGHEVRLPLSTTATMTGGLFTASVDAACQMVPDGLVPARVTPARTLLLLLSVEYQRIDRNQLTPYGEFGVFIPAVPDDNRATLLAALTGGLGGYTWQLPVTSEPARALGDIWQFPKTVASVAFERKDIRRQTTLAVDGQRVLQLDVPRSRTVPLRLTAQSYTDGDGTVRRVPVRVAGHGGLTPSRSRVDLGDHAWADQLRVLGVGPTSLASIAFEGEFMIYPPERLE